MSTFSVSKQCVGASTFPSGPEALFSLLFSVVAAAWGTDNGASISELLSLWKNFSSEFFGFTILSPSSRCDFGFGSLRVVRFAVVSAVFSSSFSRTVRDGVFDRPLARECDDPPLLEFSRVCRGGVGFLFSILEMRLLVDAIQFSLSDGNGDLEWGFDVATVSDLGFERDRLL